MTRYSLVQRGAWPALEPRCLLHVSGCRDIPAEAADIFVDEIDAPTARRAIAACVAQGLTDENDVRIMPCAGRGNR